MAWLTAGLLEAAVELVVTVLRARDGDLRERGVNSGAGGPSASGSRTETR